MVPEESLGMVPQCFVVVLPDHLEVHGHHGERLPGRTRLVIRHAYDNDSIPHLPAEWHDSSAEDAQNSRHSRYTTSHNHPIHESTQEQLPDLNEGGPLQDVSYRVEVLVLWIFDEPHSPRTHNRSTSRKKDGELIPESRFSTSVMKYETDTLT